MRIQPSLLLLLLFAFVACSDDSDDTATPSSSTNTNNTNNGPTDTDLTASMAKFAGVIDFNDLENYAAQTVPSYITRDNTANNPITDHGATLGRILFYDKELSIDRSISCGSCHQQSFGFSDLSLRSAGVNGGMTGRHSMRLINARFAQEDNFFWDERAATLELQTTMPIQDHAEMGFSGTSGNPDLNDLLLRMDSIDYYKELFTWVYGDSIINESRMQLALAQFVRSIQSFDSKFDQGLSAAGNINQNFSNYTAEENQGKALFLAPPNQNGAGCQGCHRAPEFDIDPASQNNGVTTSIAGGADYTNTRAPSLRDIFNANGSLNGPLMHDGSLASLELVIDHYNRIIPDPANTNLDRRLLGGGPGGGPPQGQNLNLSQAEKDALVAFIKTLSGSDVYTNSKWSDPF